MDLNIIVSHCDSIERTMINAKDNNNEVYYNLMVWESEKFLALMEFMHHI